MELLSILIVRNERGADDKLTIHPLVLCDWKETEKYCLAPESK